MRTLKYKAFCLIELTDNLSELPNIHKTAKEAVRSSRSYHGHPCDDPRKRGAICEVEIRVKVGTMPPVTDDLRDYVTTCEGSPALLVIGDDKWNKAQSRAARLNQRRMIAKLASK
jgi:hypothetical protein